MRTVPSPPEAADGRAGDGKGPRAPKDGDRFDSADQRRSEVVVVLDRVDDHIREGARNQRRIDPHDAVDVVGLPGRPRLRRYAPAATAVDEHAGRPSDMPLVALRRDEP